MFSNACSVGAGIFGMNMPLPKSLQVSEVRLAGSGSLMLWHVHVAI